jgi:release factor glutamine methyltransferase
MEVRSNRIGDVRQYYRNKLLGNYDESEADALLFLLIEEYTGISQVRSLSDPGLTISESGLLKIHFAVKDLNNHKPVQYILGKTQFYGLPMMVSPEVLIPRPETEELVAMVIKENKFRDNLRIFEIGTGSGCIAIALKKFLLKCKVLATDISTGAIQVAESNSLLNGVEVEFRQIDFLDESNWNQFGFFDIIISNPPYVRSVERANMGKNVVDFEPALALFVEDEDPLVFYKAISRFSRNHLSEMGIVYCEINQYLGKEVLDAFSIPNFTYQKLIKDLSGNDRFIKAGLNE